MLRAWLDASARRRYGQFVLEGMGGTTLWAALRQQICLDDERFVERMQREAEIQGDEPSIPRAQRRAPVPSLAAIARKHRDRDDAIVTAYGTGVYSYREIAEHFQLHLASVGRIIRARMLPCRTDPVFFVERMQRKTEIQGDELIIPRAQRTSALACGDCAQKPRSRRCDRYRLWHRRVQLPRDRRTLPIASCDCGPDYPSTNATMRELTPFSLSLSLI